MLAAEGLPATEIAARIGCSRPTVSMCAGVPVKVVSERIGHADPAVTMQVYAHALEDDDATAAEMTASAIFDS